MSKKTALSVTASFQTLSLREQIKQTLLIQVLVKHHLGEDEGQKNINRIYEYANKESNWAGRRDV